MSRALGSTAPHRLVTISMSYLLGQPWPIALYMIGMVLITFCSVFLAQETVKTDLSSR